MSSPGSSRRGEKRTRPNNMSSLRLFDGQHRHLPDLNLPPPVEESFNEDSTSNEFVSHNVSAGVMVSQTPQVLERTDSTRSLPRAREQGTRMQNIVIIIDDDSDETNDASSDNGPNEQVHTLPSLRMPLSRRHDRSRASSSNLAIGIPAANTTLSMVPQSQPQPDKEDLKEPSPEAALESPPEPMKEVSKFICPICMCDLVDATSTVCGHVFCKMCIKAAVKAQKKCPTCRRKLSMKNVHRVYLPTSD